MTTLYAAVRTALSGDGALAALATGGVHDHVTVGRKGLTRETLMTSGQVAIRPGVYLNWTTDNPWGDHDATLKAARAFVEVFFYEDAGYATIKAMRERVKALLRYNPVTYDEPGGEFCHDILWRGDLTGMFDDALDVCMERSRYEVILTRSV
jgi:hypothetical protein